MARGHQRNEADKKGEDEERGAEDGKDIWNYRSRRVEKYRQGGENG